MKLPFPKRAMVPSLAVALGLMASQGAQAFVYAGSELSLTNLIIDVGGITSGSATSFTFSTATSASMNLGTNQSDGDSDSCGGTLASNTCSAISPVLSSDAANAPGSGLIRADGDYSLSMNHTTNYANANAAINTAELVQGLPTSVSLVTEANLARSGSAAADSSVGSQTGFSFTFEAPGGAAINLSFYASLVEWAVIDNPGAFTRNANALFGSTVTASLQGGNSWSPNGSLDGTEVADPFNLNFTNGVSAFNDAGNPSNASHNSGGPLYYEANLVTPSCEGLIQCQYTLNLTAENSVIIRQEVPAPAPLALLGIGLAALGWRKRQQKRAA